MPASGPRLKEGDLAPRDYRARVAYRVVDGEATRRDREAAAARCPRVFRENASHLDRVPREMERFLRGVLDARRLDDLAPAARDKWGVAPEKLSALREGLDRKWIQAAIEPVESALRQAGEAGIMDSSDQQLELNSARYEIVVHGDADAEKESRRSVTGVLDYPGGARRFLAEKLDPVLQNRPAGFREVFLDLVTHTAVPTLKLDRAATAQAIVAARDDVGQRYRTVARNSLILSAGERVTPQAMSDIRIEEAAYAGKNRFGVASGADGKELARRLIGAAGVTGIFLLGFSLLALCVGRVAPEPFASNTRLAGFYAVGLLTLAAVRLLEQLGMSLQWSPVLLAAMFFAVTMGPLAAFGAVALISMLAAIAANGGLSLALPLLTGGAVAILELRRVRRRTRVLEAGVLGGVMQCAVLWAMWAVRLAQAPSSGLPAALPLEESLASVGGGILAGSVFTAALPYVERFFDVATDLRLLEWTDQNQPLLRKLAFEAPGTYHHSTVVSNIAEVATEQMGGNALLARAGGYLHDVGKISRPEYFVENAGGQPSRHEKLSPVLSTLILTAHTKDGVELAAQYGVPSPIQRIIGEHHGTSVVEFFYNKAAREGEKTGQPVQEENFRYRGPKPRSREAAIVMLADSVESAARSMDYASPAKMEHLVHEIVEKRLKDGQLDESGMNVTDIRLVEKSLVRSLTAISHPRIRYAAL